LNEEKDRFGRNWISHEGDPRKVTWVRAGDLFIDANVQRPMKPIKLAKMRAEGYNAAKTEGITVSQRPDGRLAIVEGQYRVSLAQETDPDLLLIAVLIDGLSISDEARLAAEISKDRTRHNALDQWKLAQEAGDPYAIAADVVLAELNLTAGAGQYHRNIAAVGTLLNVIHEGENASQGSAILYNTLKIIDGIPESGKPGTRWSSQMIKAVSAVVRTEGVSLERLAAKMQAQNSQYWLSFSPRIEPEIRRIYNSAKRTGKI
jgi:hypothetical protein